MTEFETTLKEYRKLVEQIADERGFLDFLQGQLTEVEEKLKYRSPDSALISNCLCPHRPLNQTGTIRCLL